jgi:hypothetical protein
MTRRAIAVAVVGALWVTGAAAAEPAAPATATRAAAPAWRAARWGMTVGEVLGAFPGEAARLEPPIVLADGNVVAVGIDGWALGADRFQVRFVFEAGRLVLVSLRSPERTYAPAERYAALAACLSAELGAPGEETRDDALVDVRQRRWDSGATRVDLKYIPGTVVVLYSPRPGAPP